LERAGAVVAELQKSSIRVPRDSIASFSYMAPVACKILTQGFDLSGSRFVVAMRLGKPQTRWFEQIHCVA
jgi:hypothetical protein